MRNPLIPVLLMGCVAAGGAADQAIHYWSGDMRVDTTVSLDAVVVTDTTPPERMRLAGAGYPATDLGASRLRVVLPAADAAQLQARLRELGLQGRARALVGGAGQASGLLTGALAVVAHPGTDVAALAAANGCVLVGPIAGTASCFRLQPTEATLLAAVDAANALQESAAVRYAIPLIERRHQRRGTPADPLFSSQWHLQNNGAGQVPGGVAGRDINITSLWDFVGGLHLGTGITVAVVDDGMERTHEDLSANARSDLGLNFNGAPGGPTDPSPGPGDPHGTWTAGLIAARDSNALGGVGVAPRARLVGIRLIAGDVGEDQDAEAMTYQVEDIESRRVHVSSNSWGPDDRVIIYPDLAQAALGPVMRAGLQRGVADGRGGLGIVYVWAAGNGREIDYDTRLGADVGADNLSFDGMASSRYVIAVGAAGPGGEQAVYSESGPALFINAPGGAYAPSGVVTTDRSGSTSLPGNYTTAAQGVSGTSFATPIVSGVVALLLEANPALTWRDVKHVLARTATVNSAGDGSWHTNAAGRQHSSDHGFGRVNALAAVTAAGNWIGVPAETTPLTAGESGLAAAVPDASPTGITRTFSVSAPVGFHAEHVELTVSASHTYRGDLTFRLTAPAADGSVGGGAASVFEGRELDEYANLNNWMFTSVAHWGERTNGTWKLEVFDTVAGDVGTLTAWSLRIHGYLAHPAPTLSGVAPARLAQGAGNSTITCTGSGFAGATRVRWNGVDLATTVVSGTSATAVVPAANLTTAGTADVTVATPGFDGEPTQVSGAVVVTVDAPPTITSLTPSSPSTPEDTAVVVSVLAADSDTPVPSLVFRATSANQALVANGNLVFGGTGLTRPLTITPAPDATGTVVLTVTVSDGVSTASTTLTLTITPVNDPPVVVSGRFRATPGLQLEGTVSAFDPDGTAVTLSATDPPGTAAQSFTLNNTTGAFTFTSKAGFRGMTSFTVKAFSGGLQSDWVPMFITVAGDPNGTRPLIVSKPSDEQIAVNGGFSYAVLVDTRRYVLAPTLTYELVGAPAGMTIDAGTGAIAWTATGADRHLTFGIVVKEALTGALDTQTVVLRIVAAGAPN